MKLDIIVGGLSILSGFICVIVCAYIYQGIWIVPAVLFLCGTSLLSLARLKFLDKRKQKRLAVLRSIKGAWANNEAIDRAFEELSQSWQR